MKDNLDYLPVWKAGASVEDRFNELAMMAQKHPERFSKLVVIYTETLASGNTVLRQASLGVSTHEMVSMLAEAQFNVLENRGG